KNGNELWNKESTGGGFRGHPENYWGRVILWKDQAIDQRGPGRAYNILTGAPVTRKNPITGKADSWEFTKVGHHCNYAIASEHLMTFRAADAGFCDLASGGPGRLVGFRSGCRNSLIPAGGVLNAPNFAHGCSCSYSIFTSLALVHVPETELWTYSPQKEGTGPIQRLGINLGAPGDRLADNGVWWLNHPNTGGPSPTAKVSLVAKSPRYFRFLATQLEGDALNWVASSGLQGLESLSIPVTVGKPAEPAKPRSFTVKLYFAEPDDAEQGARIFDVAVQGKNVLKNFDVAQATGGARKTVVQEFPGILADQEITISFTAKKGVPVLSGVEIIAE
ncbi:MAG: malectin, partial [Planctomycetales bacterium]